MGASKTLAEARGILEPLGYVLEGMNGNNHYVFRHRETGAVTRLGTAALTAKKQRQAIITQAQRSVRHAQSVSQRYVAWLLDEFGIALDEEREVSFSVMKLARKFLAEHPDVQHTSRGLWLIALKNSPLATEVKRAPRGGVGGAETAVSTWKLRGPLFGVRPIEDPAITEARARRDELAAAEARARRDELAAAFTEAKTTQEDEKRARRDEAAAGGVDDPDSGAGADVPVPARTVAAGAAPVGPVATPVGSDAAAVEAGAAQARVPGTEAPTVTLPPELAAQLADYFSGDLRAENDLAREALTNARDALQRASESVTNALELLAGGGEQQVVRRRGDDKAIRLGPVGHRRLELMEDHRDELPRAITADKLYAFFKAHDEPCPTVSAAGHALWTLEKLGVLAKSAQGVYEWA